MPQLVRGRTLHEGFRVPHPPVCIPDPYFSCDAGVSPRTVMRLHASDTPTDPYYSTTGLILPFNGNAVDYSPGGRLMTRYGGAAITTTRSLFGTSSYENESNDPASSYRSPAFYSFGAGGDHLCIDMAVFATAPGNGTNQILLTMGDVLAGEGIVVGISAAGYLYWAAGVIPTVAGTLFPANQWVRVVLQLVYTGANPQVIGLFQDGISKVTTAGALLGTFSDAEIVIGIGPFKGSIAQVRVGNTHRYEIAQDNTPLPFAFPLGYHPLAADCSCARPKTATFTGDATAQSTYRMFGPRAFYVPALASTNNTLNGLVVTDDTDFDNGTDDFAWRLWAYRFNNIREGYLLRYTETGGVISIRAALTTGNILLEYSSSGGTQSVNTGVPFPLNQWKFVVLQRRGTNWELYLHGVLISQVAITGGAGSTVNSAGPIYIGRTNVTSNTPWNGAIDEFDIVRGVAPYTGNFTPPGLPNCCHR